MNKKILHIIIIIFIFLFISIIFFKKNTAIPTNAQSTLSNNKIEWGIKRADNHDQPDLGKKNRELIEEYNGIAIGNSERKYIYLTFDNGYEAGYTENILNILQKHNVKATFFITSHYLNTATNLVERMINEGHIIGNHTVKHKSMPSLTNEELTKEIQDLHTQVYEKFGYEMKYIRPPKGEYSENSLNIISRLGYTTVMWSFAYADWDEKAQPSCQEGINKIISNLHNGEVMLLHATSKTNMEILEEVIKQTTEMGYEFKSLDEFIY